jgi:serine protease Do
MPFPIRLSSADDPTNFLIHDPFGIRHAIISLLAIDDRTGRISGLGTAFRVDPFGQYLTAQHVLEDWLAPVPPRKTVVGLLNPGLVYGRVPLPDDVFVTIASSRAFRTRAEDLTLDRLLGRDSTRMTLDCMMLSFKSENQRLNQVRDFLPLRLSGKPPQIGDQIMAIGFPELGNTEDREIDDDVLTERMCGSIGRVTQVLPAGRDHRPWPTFAVDVHWPRGMSGGPAFNLDGEVVGLVSSSDERGSSDARSYAFWFAPVRGLQRQMPHVDPFNPGWIRGWAVIRHTPRHIAAVAANRERAEEICARMGDGYVIQLGVLKAGTDDFMHEQEPVIRGGA